MIYGLIQYYNDELNGWNRTLEFHKDEARELVRKIAVVLNPDLESSSQKESSGFIDQFMLEQQKFDHISNQITSQLQRLGRTASFSGKPIEDPICEQQDLLRARMQSIERNFSKIKYTCSIFLSEFLSKKLSALMN